MTPDETKTYIERRLREVGWEVRIPGAGYERIQSYTGGEESRLNQLYYKLVSIGSQQPKREVNDDVVTLAIDELQKMDDLLEKAGVRPTRQENLDNDRQSIEQLAAALEQKASVESGAAKKEKRNNTPATASVVAPAETKAPSAAGQLPKMLVVDDSATIRAVVTKALAKDFSMVEASDGEQAWKLLKEDDSIEIVITDLMMPNLDGYGLINRIRSDQSSPRFANLPIIVVTALADANAKLKALVAGANDFITKNTDALEMQARVLARYKLAQTTAGHPRHRHVAAEPAATHARTSNSMATVAHARQVRNAPVAPARPKPVEPSQGARVASRPISEQPSAHPKLSLEKVVALHPTLKKAADAAATARSRLEQLGPSTLITLGATALFFVVVGIIFYINRVSPKPAPLPAEVAKIEGTSASEAPGDVMPRAAGDVLARTQTPNTTAARVPAAGGAKPSEPVVKPRAEATIPGVMGGTPPQTPPAVAPARAAPEPAPQRAAAPAPSAPPAPPAAETSAAPAVAAAAAVGAVVAAEPAAASPQAQPEEAEQAAVAVAARPADPASPTAPKASPNRITQAELTTLLRKFAFTYEAGDIEQFISLFDDDVRTNDRASKAGLREDYESLFKNSINRQMLLGNVAWEINDKQANGFGNFEVRIKRAGDEEVKTFKGSLTFYVEKVDGRLRIKRMYHGQYRAGG